MNPESKSSILKYNLKDSSDSSDVDRNEDSQDSSALDAEQTIKEEITVEEHNLEFPESFATSDKDLMLPQPSKDKKKEIKTKKELEEEEREKMQ